MGLECLDDECSTNWSRKSVVRDCQERPERYLEKQYSKTARGRLKRRNNLAYGREARTTTKQTRREGRGRFVNKARRKNLCGPAVDEVTGKRAKKGSTESRAI